MLMRCISAVSQPRSISLFVRKMSVLENAATVRNRIVWMDLEMTGLDTAKDHILEAAVLITDADLEIVAEGPNLIIHQPDSILDAMGEWCKKTHGESGLTEASRQSKISVQVAQEIILDFVSKHTNIGECPLAGNSIGEDKRFLNVYMPKLINHFHYRIIDVSTIKELCRRWYPDVLKQAPRKKLTHRALEDIKESIAELKYYRGNLFK